jgi:hypothetical protein
MKIRLMRFIILILLGIGCAQAIPITYTAELSGLNENPPSISPGTGFATVIFDDTAHTLFVEVSFSDLLADATAAHIHCCIDPPGNTSVATITPSFPGFPNVTSGTYSNTFDLTLASSFNGAFITANGGTPAGAEAALGAGLAAGQAYFNVHTAVFPGGEIRGFLAAVPEPSTFSLLGVGMVTLLLTLQSSRPQRFKLASKSV